MQETKFYRMGKCLYRFRWSVIGLWFVFVLACLPFLPNIVAPFKTTGFVDEQADSTKAEQYLTKKLGYNNYNKFVIIYNSKSIRSSDPVYISKIKKSLLGLKDFPIKHQIILPVDNKKQFSKDKHTAYVVVMLKKTEPINDALLQQFKDAIKTPKGMSIQLGGEPVFVESVNQQTQEDLFNADLIATPVAIITLLLVFGSVMAAILPVFLGGATALIILTLLFSLGHLFTLSIFTLNIALLLGLCLSLDYSLFIISRFRDELAQREDLAEAIAITQATAGKAIFFSGLAVFASLSALLLFPVNILFSVAIGGLTAVFVAMLMAITLLPAVLSVLNKRINCLSLRLFKKKENNSFSFWHWIAESVVKRPLFFFFSTLLFLMMLGYPFFSTQLGISDYRILPKESEDRRFFDIYAQKFKEQELTPIQLLVRTHTATVFSRQNLSKLYDLAHKLKANPSVDQVNSIVTTDSRLSKANYYLLYKFPKKLNEGLKTLLATTTGSYLTVMNIVSKNANNTPETKSLIKKMRNLSASHGMSLQLTGTPVGNSDVLATITRILPYALLWIIVFSYLILLVLLRSLFLPFKAILMNILSLSACYGALVLVFQEGYLHQFLNFEPQGMLDISLLVIIFCALFGFSMDYEVFLLTRIKEAYDVSGDNEQSIVFGIEHSSRIITSAALIVIVICCSFLVADVLMVKAFGLGIAIAIFVDAFIVRTLLVPATMALVKSWNWYLPKWLDKILPKL